MRFAAGPALRMPAGAVRVSARVATALDCVEDVVGLRSRLKVLRIITPWGVAFMPYYDIRRRHRAVFLASEAEGPRQPVSSYILHIETNLAIPAVTYATLPKEAAPFGGFGGDAV